MTIKYIVQRKKSYVLSVAAKTPYWNNLRKQEIQNYERQICLHTLSIRPNLHIGKVTAGGEKDNAVSEVLSKQISRENISKTQERSI